MISLATGTKFYYADRNKKKPIKCEVQFVQPSLPTAIFARREDTGEVFKCYSGFGCYDLGEYDKAFVDAQIQKNRIIY